MRNIGSKYLNLSTNFTEFESYYLLSAGPETKTDEKDACVSELQQPITIHN